MTVAPEPIVHETEAGVRIKHIDVADLGRVAPGFAAEEEANFAGFLTSLRQAGDAARCSFEGAYRDIGSEIGPLIRFMRQRAGEQPPVTWAAAK